VEIRVRVSAQDTPVLDYIYEEHEKPIAVQMLSRKRHLVINGNHIASPTPSDLQTHS
jgi:hypothetical protein